MVRSCVSLVSSRKSSCAPGGCMAFRRRAALSQGQSDPVYRLRPDSVTPAGARLPSPPAFKAVFAHPVAQRQHGRRRGSRATGAFFTDIRETVRCTMTKAASGLRAIGG